jgi:hypothetical protein
VRLSIDAGSVELPPGLSVDVNITVETRNQALTLPRGAVARNAGASFVMIPRGSKPAKQTVTFVDWSAERIVVASRVNTGDQVALNPLKAVEVLRVTPNAKAAGLSPEAVKAALAFIDESLSTGGA